MELRNVILAPVQSEQSYAGLEHNRYVFKVHKDATKGQIRAAVEQTNPGVTVLSVNTSTVKSKPKRRGTFQGTRPGYKRAVVKLKDGDTIQIFEGVH
ncbi:MAG: 50S ribosomal protein L23 [Thermoleophilia bacterium]|nr:50S ribosomal protein L23 [Thermoleophilia bacterium]